MAHMPTHADRFDHNVTELPLIASPSRRPVTNAYNSMHGFEMEKSKNCQIEVDHM